MLHRATSLAQTGNVALRVLRGRRFHSNSKVRYGYPHKSQALYLNRILFDASEIDSENNADDGTPWMATVTLPKSDYRTIHVAKILGLKSGDVVRAGSVIHDADAESTSSSHHMQGLLTDEATVQWLPEGKTKKDEPTKTRLVAAVHSSSSQNNCTSIAFYYIRIIIQQKQQPTACGAPPSRTSTTPTPTNPTHDLSMRRIHLNINTCREGTQRLLWFASISQTRYHERFIDRGFNIEWNGFTITESIG
jgi:hypothetical protein